MHPDSSTAPDALADPDAPGAPDTLADPESGVSMRAETLTLTGLYCPPATETCRATRMDLHRPRLLFHGRGGGSCSAAADLTLTGTLRFHANLVRGRVFGLLPLVSSTRTIPPIPLPYLVLTDVTAQGLWTRADQVNGTAMAIGTEDLCRRHEGETA
ncbi:hypothetical protein [Streptomyces sp. CT34]|uniref:hypothetical protein n=1 Tax=Streptomyces sp. CT34 TaxID=1553907 RepID=UPI000B1F4568|nr:hypothetical protein [Streptomyces sp. CT34]